jgi:hypothetical protein
VSYYNTNGNCCVPYEFATVEGNKLGNWVHDQRKKFKTGHLSDDRINLLSDLQFDFSLQANVVGDKLTVPVAISNIFKYKKEHGNISIPNKEPHKQLHRWITHTKYVSKNIIEQGNGNPNFTLPNLKLLNELGIIKLPSKFNLKETTTQKAAKKKETKKKMTKVPPKAKAQGARATVSRVSVVAPKKKITAPRPKANAPIQPKMKLKTAPKKKITAPRAKAKAPIEPKNKLKTPLTSTQVPPQDGKQLQSICHINREHPFIPFTKIHSPSLNICLHRCIPYPHPSYQQEVEAMLNREHPNSPHHRPK